MTSFVNINVPKIQGALFVESNGGTMKVYGKESAIVMAGSIRAGDEKQGDKYVPLAYGVLHVRAAKAQTQAGKEYLHLAVDGGLQGRLTRVEGNDKDYQYIGSIEVDASNEMTVFGRAKKSDDGKSYIALSSGEKKAKEAKGNGGNASTPAPGGASGDDELPF